MRTTRLLPAALAALTLFAASPSAIAKSKSARQPQDTTLAGSALSAHAKTRSIKKPRTKLATAGHSPRQAPHATAGKAVHAVAAKTAHTIHTAAHTHAGKAIHQAAGKLLHHASATHRGAVLRTAAYSRPQHSVATLRGSSSSLSGGPSQTGIASWYGSHHEGLSTANGERFDPTEMTAAHPTLPMNTKVVVTNVENGRAVTVRINDRLPARSPRIIDLSKGAAAVIGLVQRGYGKVTLQALNTR